MDDATPPLTRRELRRRREAAGGFSVRANPMPQGPVTILMVCTGNICRSALADVVMSHRLADLGVKVHSAGTFALVGHGMPREARELALARGARPEDVDRHAGRYLYEPLIAESDLVLAMTGEHRTFAVQAVPVHVTRTFTIREFAWLSSGLRDEDIRAVAASAGEDPRAGSARSSRSSSSR